MVLARVLAGRVPGAAGARQILAGAKPMTERLAYRVPEAAATLGISERSGKSQLALSGLLAFLQLNIPVSERKRG